MKPLLQSQARMGNRVPSRLPSIELSDIDPDPEKAKSILAAYEKNLPKYLEGNQDPLFPKEDEWEVPPVSTELRIFGSKKDNTTPQVIEAIKTVAGDTLDSRNTRRDSILWEIEREDALRGNNRGVPYVQAEELNVGEMYERSSHFDPNKERPVGYEEDELTGKIKLMWGQGGEVEKKEEDVPIPTIYVPQEGDHLSGGQGRDWTSTSKKKPKGVESFVQLKRGEDNTLFTMDEWEKQIKPYIDKYFIVDERTNKLVRKK